MNTRSCPNRAFVIGHPSNILRYQGTVLHVYTGMSLIRPLSRQTHLIGKKTRYIQRTAASTISTIKPTAPSEADVIKARTYCENLLR